MCFINKVGLDWIAKRTMEIIHYFSQLIQVHQKQYSIRVKRDCCFLSNSLLTFRMSLHLDHQVGTHWLCINIYSNTDADANMAAILSRQHRHSVEAA